MATPEKKFCISESETEANIDDKLTKYDSKHERLLENSFIRSVKCVEYEYDDDDNQYKQQNSSEKLNNNIPDMAMKNTGLSDWIKTADFGSQLNDVGVQDSYIKYNPDENVELHESFGTLTGPYLYTSEKIRNRPASATKQKTKFKSYKLSSEKKLGQRQARVSGLNILSSTFLQTIPKIKFRIKTQKGSIFLWIW